MIGNSIESGNFESRQRAGTQPKPGGPATIQGKDEKIIIAEREVCLRSRALYSRYVDVASWSGVSLEEKTAIGNALQRAVSVVEQDPGCISAINRRLKAFHKFHPPELTPLNG
jgi:hypothetical protein